MANVIGHFKTITKHRHKVIKHCFKAGIGLQGLRHDLSKYSPTEFFNGVKYYDGTRSPNELERLDRGYSKAWLHHKGRNKHHFEYWIDYPVNKDVGLAGMKMPVNYIVEMFCDRVAASKIYNKEKYTDNDALKYFLKGKGHYVMNKEVEKLLYKLLKMLSVMGEDYTFKYIRKKVLKNKRYW